MAARRINWGRGAIAVAAVLAGMADGNAAAQQLPDLLQDPPPGAESAIPRDPSLGAGEDGAGGAFPGTAVPVSGASETGIEAGGGETMTGAVAPPPAKAWWQEWMDAVFGWDEPEAPVKAQAPAPAVERAPASGGMDWEPRAGLSLGPESQEVTEGAGEVRLTVERTLNMGARVTVRWRLGAPGDTARAGQDYQAAEGELTFAPGEARKEIVVRLLDDTAWRDPERRILTVELSDPVGGRLRQERAQIAITEDDTKAPPPPRPGELGALAPVDFGAVDIGAEARRQVGLRNRGGRPIEISRVIAPADVLVIRDECSGQLIEPLQGCGLEILFAPTREGAAPASLPVQWREVAAGGVQAVLDVPLMGEGLRAAPPPDPLLAARREARERRRSAGGEVRDLVDDPPPPPPAPEYVMSQPGYPGMARGEWTLTVDLTRAIPTVKVIPCVLMDTINSQLPGSVRCIVEQPVYGMHGRMVLLESGTVWEGDYQPLARNGDTRLNVVWRRGIRPDGSAFFIDSGLQALDAMGRAGLPGPVNNRTWEKYGSAGLLTLFNAGTALATPTGGANGENYARAQQELARNVGDITAQVMEQNLDLRPIMTVPKGTRLHIKPTVDLWFRSPEILTSTPRPLTLQERGRG